MLLQSLVLVPRGTVTGVCRNSASSLHFLIRLLPFSGARRRHWPSSGVSFRSDTVSKCGRWADASCNVLEEAFDVRSAVVVAGYHSTLEEDERGESFCPVPIHELHVFVSVQPGNLNVEISCFHLHGQFFPGGFQSFAVGTPWRVEFHESASVLSHRFIPRLRHEFQHAFLLRKRSFLRCNGCRSFCGSPVQGQSQAPFFVLHLAELRLDRVDAFLHFFHSCFGSHGTC